MIAGDADDCDDYVDDVDGADVGATCGRWWWHDSSGDENVGCIGWSCSSIVVRRTNFATSGTFCCYTHRKMCPPSQPPAQSAV